MHGEVCLVCKKIQGFVWNPSNVIDATFRSQNACYIYKSLYLGELNYYDISIVTLNIIIGKQDRR